MPSSNDSQVHSRTVISGEGNGDQVSSHVPEIDDGDNKSPQKEAEDNATSPDSYDDNDDDVGIPKRRKKKVIKPRERYSNEL